MVNSESGRTVVFEPSGVNGFVALTKIGSPLFVIAAMRMISRPGRALGPTAVRTRVTENSVPSNSGVLVSRFGVMNSDAPRSAMSWSSAILTSSLRCARAIPRFQLGSHCDVIEARAASTTPIKAIAIRASISVKPEHLSRRVRKPRIMGIHIIGALVASEPSPH